MVNIQILATGRERPFDWLLEVDIVQKVLKALVIALSQAFAQVPGLCHFNGARAQVSAACTGLGRK